MYVPIKLGSVIGLLRKIYEMVDFVSNLRYALYRSLGNKGTNHSFPVYPIDWEDHFSCISLQMYNARAVLFSNVTNITVTYVTTFRTCFRMFLFLWNDFNYESVFIAALPSKQEGYLWIKLVSLILRWPDKETFYKFHLLVRTSNT